MKILLLGEFSGLFNSLKEGLIDLGHDVTLMSDGDDFKKYPSDYSWRIEIRGKYNKYGSIIKGIFSLNQFKGFDVVCVISPTVIMGKFHFAPKLFEYLKKHNKKVFLCGAGMTASIFKYWYDHKGTKYNKYVDGYIIDAGGEVDKVKICSKALLSDENKIMSIVDGYIPIMYEYAAPFLNHPKYKGIVPIPINVNKFEYEENHINGKIRIFHGLTKTCKGGKYILDAFDKLSAKYGHDVEFIAKGNIPFEKYIPYLRSMNIVIDDANAYSLGMNALFSMAMGRIVLGGSELLGNQAINYKLQNPAFNIVSDSNKIANVLEYLICNKENFKSIGEQSRQFVCKEHDYLEVASRYLEIWGS